MQAESFAQDPDSDSSEVSNLGNAVYESKPEYEPFGAPSFVISQEFVLNKDIPVGSRNKLIMKYVGDLAPYPGWAIALRRNSTSVRPELYWKDSEGRGGWLTFAEVDLLSGRPYSLSLVASGSEVAIFIEELVQSAEQAGEDRKQKVSSERLSTVKFLGGYDVSDIKTPQTSGQLQTLKESPPSSRFGAKVSRTLIVRTKKLFDTQKKLKSFLVGGPRGIKDKVLPEEIAFESGIGG